MSTEQAALRTSIAVTVFLAVFGIGFGILSGSFSIAFDGAYTLIDAGMSGLALMVSTLIVKSAQTNALPDRLQHRFSMGFWHLEPIVLGVNGTLLIAVAIYALINALITLGSGGHELEFQYAILYAVLTLVACLTMAIRNHRANQRIKSDFLALDAKSWAMSAAITAALLIAFSVGYAIQGTELGWLAPYVDPAALALICLVIIPIPVSTVKQALSDVLLVTPRELQEHVEQIAADAVQRYGFLSYRSYVARVGRARQIELYFIVPDDMPAKTIREWDHIRDEIGEAIGGDTPDRWLTIAFTADVEWAE